MPIDAEWFAGFIATRIAAGVTGIGRMSTAVSAMQAELKTWTDIVAKAVQRLENHETRLASLEGQLTPQFSEADKLQRALDVLIRREDPPRSRDEP